MEALRQRMIDDMRIRNFSAGTIRGYVGHVDRFAKHCGVSPDKLGREEVRRYLLSLLDSGRSRGTVLCVLSALRFFYQTTVGREWKEFHLRFPRKEKRLPEVLSREELREFFAALDTPKPRAVLMTLYATGLRVAEARELLPTDIDSKRMVHSSGIT